MEQATTTTTTTTSSSSSSHSAWLWLSDEENWERFGAEDVAQIEQAVSIGNKGVVLERNFTIYFLDLLRLTQTNATTGKRRPIYQVQRGSSWLSRNSETEVWEPFSRTEAAELEQAFFDGNELFILQRGTVTQYVDFLKFEMADLSAGTTSYLKVAHNETDEEGDDEVEEDLEEEESALCPAKSRISVRSSGIRSRSTSRSRRKKDAFKSQVGKFQEDLDDDCCECTVTTVPEDNDSSVSSGDVSVARRSSIRRSVSRRTSATWQWANDAESWSLFDEEVAAAIERSWEFGAPELMFERDSTAYFVDLINLTQTNIHTGMTRAIQRVETKVR